jgi:hypothetical protein
MPSMRAVLEARQKAAAVRVEELEAELDQLRAALVEAEEVLRHRVIGLEQYLEALAEEDAPAVAVVSQRRRWDRAGRCLTGTTRPGLRCCRWTTRR